MTRCNSIAIIGLSLLGWGAPGLAQAREPTPSVTPEPRPEPPDGKGLTSAGIFGVTFGIINIGYGIPLAITGPGDAYFAGYIPIAFGAAFVTLGAFGIHYGKRRRRDWQSWKCDPWAPAPVHDRSGRSRNLPWLIVGAAVTPLGITTTALTIPAFTDPILNVRPAAYALLSWGTASTAIGLGMLTVGAVLVGRDRHAKKHSAHLEWTPVPWARRDGFGLAVAGRF